MGLKLMPSIRWCERREQGKGTVQGFPLPMVTSWQIPKLEGLPKGDIQVGRAGPGRPGCQQEGLGFAPSRASALGRCSLTFSGGLAPRRHADPYTVLGPGFFLGQGS